MNQDHLSRLENVLEYLRYVALNSPGNLPISIAESNALIQISDFKFSEDELAWFNNEVERIIEIYMGGVLYPHEYYTANRAET